jgi:hypothetical protein
MGSSAVDARLLLERLLRVVAGSRDYFVSGSLSFLPLLPPYREPGHDVDAALEQRLFEARRGAISAEGEARVLRLAEVAVAQDSAIARWVSPRTGFVHVETADGLLDLAAYTAGGGRISFGLGGGLSGSLPAQVLDRVRTLEWKGLCYRAGPPELAFLPKALLHVRARRRRSPVAPELRKHELDLERMLPIVDWDFASLLLREGTLRWLGLRVPGLRRLGPLRWLDLGRLREELAGAPRSGFC